MKKLLLLSLIAVAAVTGCQKEKSDVSYIENLSNTEVYIYLNHELKPTDGEVFYFNESTTFDLFVKCSGTCKFRYNGQIFYQSTQIK